MAEKVKLSEAMQNLLWFCARPTGLSKGGVSDAGYGRVVPHAVKRGWLEELPTVGFRSGVRIRTTDAGREALKEAGDGR